MPRPIGVLLILIIVDSLAGQAGDSVRGKALLIDQGCLSCHSVGDVGGQEAPDLGQPTEQVFSPAAFAAAVWNHVPQMWVTMAPPNRDEPQISDQGMRDLFAYLYSVRYFEPSGDARRGEAVYQEKQCYRCHEPVDTGTSGIGPGITHWRAPSDLVLFLENMWNHGEAMNRERREHRTITDLAVAMWNHRPIMEEWSKETGLPIRNFERGQMGQLLSYLFEEGFLEERGTAERGAVVYADKGCAQCHDNGTAAPLLRTSYTVTDLTAGMWRHGPAVRQAMRDQRMTWPHLSASDIADLVAWLNRR